MSDKTCKCYAHGPSECVCGAWDNVCYNAAHKTLEAEVKALRAELCELQQSAGNVLAGIHGDGGQYVSKHGWEKACKDADVILCQKYRTED